VSSPVSPRLVPSTNITIAAGRAHRLPAVTAQVVQSQAATPSAPMTVNRTRLQDPYRLALQEALGEPEHRVLFFVDVVVGTLLHRMGMTGEPMVDADVAALVEMALPHFADGPGPA
jgi:hypothetical protein